MGIRQYLKFRLLAFSLLVITERPQPTRLFLKNRGPRHASLLGWKNRWKKKPRTHYAFSCSAQAVKMAMERNREHLPSSVRSRKAQRLNEPAKFHQVSYMNVSQMLAFSEIFLDLMIPVRRRKQFLDKFHPATAFPGPRLERRLGVVLDHAGWLFLFRDVRCR